MLIITMLLIGIVGWYGFYDSANIVILILLVLYTVATFTVAFYFICIKEDRLIFLQKCFVVKNGVNPYKNIRTWLSFFVPIKVLYEDILQVKYSDDSIYVAIHMKNNDRYVISLLTYSKKSQNALREKFNSLNLIKEGE
jgi:hypothetical protein